MTLALHDEQRGDNCRPDLVVKGSGTTGSHLGNEEPELDPRFGSFATVKISCYLLYGPPNTDH